MTAEMNDFPSDAERNPLRLIQHLQAENAELRRRLAETQERPVRGRCIVPAASQRKAQEGSHKLEGATGPYLV